MECNIVLVTPIRRNGCHVSSRNGGNPRVGSLSDWPDREHDGEPHGFASGGLSKELPSARFLGDT